MGTLTPIATGIGQVAGIVGGLSSITRGVTHISNAFGGSPDYTQSAYEQQSRLLRAQQDLALKQLQERQDVDWQSLQTGTAQEQQKIALDAANAETARRDALRRAVSRQRAAYGAQGISAGDGSSQAVLLGLFEDSEEDRQARDRADALRLNILNQNIETQNRINILQRSQLQERQKLERIAQAR